ncbi:MAG: hypothetical protein JWR10_1223 [Rubritepida sp.]|nr:hypothetical protein [Rubritepida sp.]
MRETYKCRDAREALLEFDRETLRVSVISPTGHEIGYFQFEVVHDHLGPNGLNGSNKAPASLRPLTSLLSDAWTGQGIAERANRMMSDITRLPAAAGRRLYL